MSKKMTSIDIAKLAGVSQTTVSLVLRNKWKGRVSSKVAEHVIKICDENNYRANHAARTLRSGNSKNIALVVPDSENPFFGHILHHLRKASDDLGYVCMLIETANNPNWYSFVETSILGNEIDIAIICYNDFPRMNPAINNHIIVINDLFDNINTISLDFYSAVKDGVKKLYKKGYRKLVHVRSIIKKPTFTSRINAFNETCNELGIFHTDILLKKYTRNNLFEILEETKDSFTYPMAFILDDDLFAPGIYRFAQKNKLEIGREIGIISLDSTFICYFFHPILSSYGYDSKILVGKIMEMIENIHKGDLQPKHFILPMEMNSGASF
ncbi:MAG: LacI family DNA-binding transcriptional regulator [Sphaerochaeta sp.]